MGHLTESAYLHLLAGTLAPDEAAALARHLDGACAECEAFLAARGAVDALDGAVDRALAAAGAPGQPGNDLEFARIERRLAARPRTTARGGLLAGLLAAAVLAAGVAGVVAGHAPGRPGWDGVKGVAPRPIPVRLRFLVLSQEPGRAPALEKGVTGEAVPSRASLQFEVETGRAASVAVVRVPARGAPEVVWRDRVGTGRTPVSVEGRPAAYPLSELSGPQRFVLVASDAPLDEARLAGAAAPLAPPAGLSADVPALDGLSLDVVEVDVR